MVRGDSVRACPALPRVYVVVRRVANIETNEKVLEILKAVVTTYGPQDSGAITNSVEARPVTVGLQVFSATDQGIDWSIITAATLLSTGPLLIAFLLFQRQFVQSFMRAGIR